MSYHNLFCLVILNHFIKKQKISEINGINSIDDKLIYKQLYQESPDLYRTINADGIIIKCNKAYANHLGYSIKQVIGQSIFDHVPNEGTKAMRSSFEKWKRTGQVENMQVIFKKKDGTTFPALISANDIYDKKGKVIGSNTVIHDITEIFQKNRTIIEHQNKIKKQYTELKKLNILKDEFLTMITHELKTPLVPIKGYVDMLLSKRLGQLNDMQREKLGIVKLSTETLLKLVADLLDAQKIELGQLKMTKGIHDLAGIIDTAVIKMKEEVEKNGMLITTDLQRKLFCLCDQIRIEQVITNLFTNAIKFSTKKQGRISVKLISSSGNAKIIIKDNGIGIVKNNLKKVFVKFYQIDTSTTREYGGTGLGLTVCKGLIESHGGKIWAKSEGRNKGTEIHILLPISKDL